MSQTRRHGAGPEWASCAALSTEHLPGLQASDALCSGLLSFHMVLPQVEVSQPDFWAAVDSTGHGSRASAWHGGFTEVSPCTAAAAHPAYGKSWCNQHTRPASDLMQTAWRWLCCAAAIRQFVQELLGSASTAQLVCAELGAGIRHASSDSCPPLTLMLSQMVLPGVVGHVAAARGLSKAVVGRGAPPVCAHSGAAGA